MLASHPWPGDDEDEDQGPSAAARLEGHRRRFVVVETGLAADCRQSRRFHSEMVVWSSSSVRYLFDRSATDSNPVSSGATNTQPKAMMALRTTPQERVTQPIQTANYAQILSWIFQLTVLTSPYSSPSLWHPVYQVAPRFDLMTQVLSAMWRQILVSRRFQGP